MPEQNQIKQSSVVVESVEKIEKDQFSMPTWGIIIFLILALLVLKTFIYIKDQKRHGK